MMVIQNFAKNVMIRYSRGPPCPYMVKTIYKRLLLKNHWANLADILPEADGTPPYIKQLKLFRADDKQTFSGRGKFGKMT